MAPEMLRSVIAAASTTAVTSLLGKCAAFSLHPTCRQYVALNCHIFSYCLVMSCMSLQSRWSVVWGVVGSSVTESFVCLLFSLCISLKTVLNYIIDNCCEYRTFFVVAVVVKPLLLWLLLRSYFLYRARSHG